jgi:hypothetical protein
MGLGGRVVVGTVESSGTMGGLVVKLEALGCLVVRAETKDSAVVATVRVPRRFMDLLAAAHARGTFIFRPDE